MQFLAIVSVLAAAVAANPLSIPAQSLSLDAGASITLTVSKVITVPAISVPSSICFTVPSIPTATLSIPPFTLTNTIPGVTIDPATLTKTLPGATVTLPPRIPGFP